MTITETLTKFMDDTYMTPCWDDFTVLDSYVAVSDRFVAKDLEEWLLESDIPFDKKTNKSAEIVLFNIIDKTF